MKPGNDRPIRKSRLFVNLRAWAAEGFEVRTQGQGLEGEGRACPKLCGPCSYGDGLPGGALGFGPRAPRPPRSLSGYLPCQRGLGAPRAAGASREIQLRLWPFPARQGRISPPQNPLGNCRRFLSHQCRRARSRVAKTVGFFSQEPCLGAEMEPNVVSFSNLEIRWAKIFRTLRCLGFGVSHCRGRSMRVPAAVRPEVPTGPGSCKPSRAVADPPAPRFLENRVSAMLISAPF